MKLNDQESENTSNDNEKNLIAWISESKFLSLSILNTSFLLAFLAGISFLKGFVYLEHYYNLLDIPIDRLNFSVQKITIYGSVDLITFTVALLIFVAASSTIAVLLALFENPQKPRKRSTTPPKWITTLKDRASKLKIAAIATSLLIILALLGYAFWQLTISIPSERANKNAIKTAEHCTQSRIKTNSLDTYNACILAESDDMIYLLERTEEEQKGEHIKFKTFMLPKQRIISIESSMRSFETKNLN